MNDEVVWAIDTCCALHLEWVWRERQRARRRASRQSSGGSTSKLPNPEEALKDYLDTHEPELDPGIVANINKIRQRLIDASPMLDRLGAWEKFLHSSSHSLIKRIRPRITPFVRVECERRGAIVGSPRFLDVDHGDTPAEVHALAMTAFRRVPHVSLSDATVWASAIKCNAAVLVTHDGGFFTDQRGKLVKPRKPLKPRKRAKGDKPSKHGKSGESEAESPDKAWPIVLAAELGHELELKNYGTTDPPTSHATGEVRSTTISQFNGRMLACFKLRLPFPSGEIPTISAHQHALMRLLGWEEEALIFDRIGFGKGAAMRFFDEFGNEAVRECRATWEADGARQDDFRLPGTPPNCKDGYVRVCLELREPVSAQKPKDGLYAAIPLTCVSGRAHASAE